MVGQTVETENSMEIIDLDKIVEATTFEATRGYGRQDNRGEYRDSRFDE